MKKYSFFSTTSRLTRNSCKALSSKVLVASLKEKVKSLSFIVPYREFLCPRDSFATRASPWTQGWGRASSAQEAALSDWTQHWRSASCRASTPASLQAGMGTCSLQQGSPANCLDPEPRPPLRFARGRLRTPSLRSPLAPASEK